MKKVGIIGGSGFRDYQNDNAVFLQRHGAGIPPHKIDHKENISNLKDQNVTDIIAISSVGSLNSEITPGTIVIPDDYINLFNIKTFFEEKAVHIVPGISENLRNKIKESAKSINQEIIFVGTYFQTLGPRFETKAEIKMISQFADIVGMTMANEATLAKELGLSYACICMVDNYANGTKSEIVLDEDKVKKTQSENMSKITKLLNEILK